MQIDLEGISPKTIEIVGKLLFHAVDQMKVNKQAKMYYHADGPTIDNIDLFRTKLECAKAGKEVENG